MKLKTEASREARKGGAAISQAKEKSETADG